MADPAEEIPVRAQFGKKRDNLVAGFLTEGFELH